MKPTKLFFIIIISTLLGNLSYTQTGKISRDKNWNPKGGKYFFSKKLTYTFINDMAEEPHLRSGEFSIYVDEKSGTILFNRDSYGWSGEMVNFVIADKKGNYTFGYTDEFGKKYKEVLQSDQYKQIMRDKKKIRKEFTKYYKSTGKSKVFGANDYDWPVMTAKEYEPTDQKSTNTTKLYLATTSYCLLAVYLFNTLKSEAKLPAHMLYANMVPEKYIVLGEECIRNDKISSVTLKTASPAEHFLDINQYRIIK